MIKQINKIIIWGKDNFNTLGLLRQLSGEGRSVFFLMWDEPTGCASSSRFFGEHAIVKSLDEGYQYLSTHFLNEALKPVLFTPSDEIIEFIDQHKIELQKSIILPGTREPGLLSKIDDKNSMTALAARLGFQTPTSKTCCWNTDISGIQYPCILKPAHTTVGHKNEFKYLICKNEKELQNALKYVRKESEFVLQQYIPKESVALVYGARMKDGKVKIAGVLIKDRFIASGDGSHGLLTTTFPSGIEEEKIIAFLEEIDYCGLFSFEYGLYNGKAYFFEVNLRNDGTSHYFYQAGANIPLAWYNSMIDKNEESINTIVTKEAWFIDEIFDEANVWNRTVSRKQWKKERTEASIFKYYAVDDEQPWKNMTRHRVRKILLDTLIKKYRLYIVWIIEKLKH